MTVHIYLDVDGVILPVELPEHVPAMAARSGWDDWTEHRLGQWQSPTMLAAVAAVGALPDVEIHWTTTWSHDAPAELPLPPPVGIGWTPAADWDVLDPDHYYRRSEGTGIAAWWKRDAVVAHMAEHPGDRFVWCDDDIDYARRLGTVLPGDPLLATMLAPADLLLVCPDTSTGLTRTDLARIAAFVA